ncbi:MAG: ComF family protein [Flavisolibacter sp.]|nr:ComF family protein [Flavisolibacter sp.]MBD0284729.1 ComF family protein [Flavisolibacter sp.]MBD0374336.1 ComF family protein [Flavisolibacter sp.]
MSLLREIKDSLLHLAFPHVCEGCGSDLLERRHSICLNCHAALPETSFHLYPNNPVEKMFWGRLPVIHATAQYYFTKESLMQRLMHQFKYRGNKELGLYLGCLMGERLAGSNRFSDVDALVPLPLFPEKEHKRGFNQAAILCAAIAEALQKPVLNSAVIRIHHTESQTKKSRVERWQNIGGRFEVADEQALSNKHILLVDDVVTTGATLEACGRTILQTSNTHISIATLCFSSES